MKKFFVAGALVLLLVAGFIFIQNVRAHGPMMGRGHWWQPSTWGWGGCWMMNPGWAPRSSTEGEFKSTGEQIYYTGIGSSGYPIPIYGGPMWMRMHGGGCVSCHGTHGKGGVPVMMGTSIPTDIRYKVLVGKEKHIHEGKEEKHHYTDALIKRTITQGLEADGKMMDWTMPRWQMSETDLNALIEYLKTLE